MPEWFVCLQFLAAVMLSGYGLLWLLDRKRVIDHWERLVAAFPSGLAATGAILYTLNVMGAPFSRPLVLSVLGCGTILGLAALTDDRADILRSLKGCAQRRFRPGPAGAICLFVAACVIIGFVARAMTEVNHLEDTELYHYPYAAIVFRTHHQPVFASQSMSEEYSFPPAIFVCYAALWTCLGHVNQILPNLLPLPIVLSWGLLTLIATRRLFHCSDGAACFAVLLFAATYELEVMVAGESADLLPVVLAGIALYWLARDIEEGKHRRLLLAAWLLGLNCWVKYQGIPFAACAAAALFIAGISHSKEEENSHPLAPVPAKRDSLVPRFLSALGAPALLFAGAVLLVVPFLIRNLVTFGSPIYPGSLGPFHGVYSSEWCVRVVGAYWQPKLFYYVPDLLGRTVREPAILLGIPAIALAYRRRDRPAIFLGWAAILFLIVFISTMNSNFPSALRFAGPSLGVLAWLGGWLAVETEGAEPSSRRRILGCFWALAAAAALLAPFVPLLWRGDGWAASILNYGWIILFVAGLTLVSLPQVSSSSPGVVGYYIALVISALALLHHKPFLDLRNPIENFRKVDWAVTTAPCDVVKWMDANVSPRSVTYTYFAGRWALPGVLFPGDDPLTEPIHRPGVPMPAVMEALRKLGIQYVLDWKGTPLDNYGAYRTDPVVAHIKDTRYFKLLRYDNISALYQVIYPGSERPLQPTAANPMPWLMQFAASGPRHGPK